MHMGVTFSSALPVCVSFLSFQPRSISRWVGRQDSVGPAPQFFGSGGPQTEVWSTKTTKDGKRLSVIFIFLVGNQYGLS